MGSPSFPLSTLDSLIQPFFLLETSPGVFHNPSSSSSLALSRLTTLSQSSRVWPSLPTSSIWEVPNFHHWASSFLVLCYGFLFLSWFLWPNSLLQLLTLPTRHVPLANPHKIHCPKWKSLSGPSTCSSSHERYNFNAYSSSWPWDVCSLRARTTSLGWACHRHISPSCLSLCPLAYCLSQALTISSFYDGESPGNSLGLHTLPTSLLPSLSSPILYLSAPSDTLALWMTASHEYIPFFVSSS